MTESEPPLVEGPLGASNLRDTRWIAREKSRVRISSRTLVLTLVLTLVQMLVLTLLLTLVLTLVLTQVLDLSEDLLRGSAF